MESQSNPVRLTQAEVYAWDQFAWRDQRQALYDRVKSWSRDQKIFFAEGYGSHHPLSSVKNSKSIFMLMVDGIPDRDYWISLSESNVRTGKMTFVITDNYVEQPCLPGVKFFVCPEFYGMHALYENYKFEDGPPSKLFNCFIQRVDSVRQSWFYFLHEHQLIEQGHVSFLLKQMSDFTDLSGPALFEWLHDHYELGNTRAFQEAFMYWRDRVPFKNFEERPDNDLVPFINDSKYSLVLETGGSNDDIGQWFWTEKVIRDLQFATIPLLFCQKGAMGILEKFGLMIPEHMKSIDQLPWIERQRIMIEMLVNDSIEYDRQANIQRAQHNRDVLSNWKKQIHHQEFFDSIFQEIKKA